MPRIPELAQRQRLSQTPPVALQSGASGAFVGSALRELGRSVSEVAINIARIEERKDISQRKLQVSEAANFLKLSAFKNETVATENAMADGENLVFLFETGFDIFGEDLIDSIEDETAKAQVRQIFGDIKTVQGLKLRQKANSMFVLNAGERIENIISQDGSVITANPDSFETQLASTSETIDQSIVFSEADKKKMIAGVTQQFALTKVLSLMDKKRFKEARSFILNKRGGELFKPLGKTGQFDLLNKIKTQKIIALNNKTRDKNIEINTQNREQKEDQEKEFQKLMQASRKAKTPQQRSEIRDQISIAVSSGKIKTSQSNFANELLSGEVGKTSEDLKLDYHERINNGETSPAFIREIYSDLNLTPDDRIGLVNLAQKTEREIEDDPSMKRLRVTIKESMEGVFGADSFFKPLRQKEKFLKSAAERFRLAREEDGREPLQALNDTYLEFGKDVKAVPLVPGLKGELQENLLSLRTEAKIRVRLFKEAKTRAEKVKHKEIYDLIAERINAIKIRDKRDALTRQIKESILLEEKERGR